MSFQITTAFVEQFHSNIDLLSQQKNSRFQMAVRNESQTGETQFFEQIGPVEAVEATSRHDDTPQIDTPHERRSVRLRTFRWADLIDNADKVRTLIDPTSSYAKSAMQTMNRKRDDLVIAAALGTSLTGRNGDVSVALPASQKVVAGATGLTVAKLREASRILNTADVDDDIRRFFAVNAKTLDDLLATTEITSSDFNTVKALVAGDIDTFMGFKFIKTQRLTLDGNGDIQNIAWAEDGLLLSKSTMTPITRITERADKNYSVQVYREEHFGATRMEEVKVVEIASNP